MSPTQVRLQTIFVLLIVNAAVLVTWTQPWFTVTLTDGTGIVVGGAVAAPALSALALSGLALAGALTIAGPVFRVVLGVLQIALGALVIASAAMAIADPVSASAQAITDATGVSGRESVAALVSSVLSSALAPTALGTGVVLVVLGLAIVVFVRRWPPSSRRYQATRLTGVDGESSPIGDWDALSDGRDPTGDRDPG